jgi:uncharacterized protein (UPF0332 family)
VSGEWVDPVERAREELRAASLLLESGLPSQAVSRACAAGVQVATAALAELGETPSTDAGVVSAFGRQVVGDDGVEPEAGRTLRQLFEDRDHIEQALLQAPEAEARRALGAAGLLVDAGARWLDQRRR